MSGASESTARRGAKVPTASPSEVESARGAGTPRSNARPPPPPSTHPSQYNWESISERAAKVQYTPKSNQHIQTSFNTSHPPLARTPSQVNVRSVPGDESGKANQLYGGLQGFVARGPSSHASIPNTESEISAWRNKMLPPSEIASPTSLGTSKTQMRSLPTPKNSPPRAGEEEEEALDSSNLLGLMGIGAPPPLRRDSTHGHPGGSVAPSTPPMTPKMQAMASVPSWMGGGGGGFSFD